jgi:hypothetical protein
MKKHEWKKLALALLSGSILFQTPGCTDTALFITSVASAITAGGVIYLVRRVVS